MSEIHIEEHSSPIKTPKQLIIVVFLAFAVPITLIVMLSQLVTSGMDFSKSNPGMSDEAIAKRLKPVGEVVVADTGTPAAKPAAVVERTGEQIVQAQCIKCHQTGEAGAPRIGDRTAWIKRATKGLNTVTLSAIRGHDGMPARGGVAELTDAEFRRAIVYMFNQVGAAVKEPQAAAPAAVAQAPAAAASAKLDASKGKTVYEANCVACHAAGIAGAPKAGDKAAWGPRIKSGMDALYTSALKGKNAMPPKGGNTSLAEGDVKAAVDYLVSQAK